MTPVCGYIDWAGHYCAADAVWAIAPENDQYRITHSCNNHVSNLLTDHQRIYVIWRLHDVQEG
jgi:predicted alpha/beta hydrolase